MSDGRVCSRVVVLGSYAPSLVAFRAELIAELVRSGNTVFAVATGLTSGLEAELKSIGAKPSEVFLSRSSLNPWFDIVTFRHLRRLFKEIDPDIVIAYTIKPVIWGTLAARIAGVKCIVPMITGLGYAFTSGREPTRLFARVVATLLYRLALAHADVVLFQNPDDMALFRKLRLLPTRVPSVVVNGSGVDTIRYSPTSLPEQLSFLMIARLLGDKGVREFGAAALLVKKRHPEVSIRLVGFLDQSPDSISEAELDGIVASGVEFVGRLDDVRPAITQSSVYVLPSYREGTPRSTLEAMAMGRAIVTTDAPGCRETVIEGVNGFLVPPRDPVALAEAMEKFISDPGLPNAWE